MKAHLIDPFLRTISAVEYSGDLADAYRLTQCECIDTVAVSSAGDRLLVDDKGLITNLEAQRFFVFLDEGGDERFLAGRALLIGTNEVGVSVEPAMTMTEAVLRTNFFQETPEAQAACMDYARKMTESSFRIVAFTRN